MADEFKGISNETLRNVELIKSSMKDIASSTNKTNRALQDAGELLADYGASYSQINKSANQFAQLQDESTKSASATAKALVEQQKQLSVVRTLNAQIENLYDRILTASDKEEKILKKQAENLSAARDNAQELAKEFESLVRDSSKLDKSTMWFSAFSEVVKDIPGIRKLSGPFEAAAEASRKTVLNNAKNKAFLEEALQTGKGLTAEKIKELGLEKEAAGLTGTAAAARLKAVGATAKTESVGIAGLQAGFKALGPIIKSAFLPLALITTVVAAFKSLVDMMFEADKQVTDLAKSLNISKDAARDVRESFFQIKDDAPFLTKILEGNLILQEDLVKTQLLFNQLLGTSIDLSAKGNEELAAQLTNANKFLKLNEEEFTGLVNIFTQTGKKVDDIKTTILGTVKAYKLQTGIQLDERKILGDVLKTSNSIKLSIKGGTDALVQATINANKFGTSLNQLEKTADSLLNFEQSISSELESELLLGRDLNLDRARAAALTNDQVALTEEVGKLIAGFGPDFQKNAIAQESFARTLGISRQELADMFTTYQQNTKLAESQRNIALKFTQKEIDLLEAKGEKGKEIAKAMTEGKLTGIQFYEALKTAGFEGKRLTEALGDLSQQSLESQSSQEKFDDALKAAKETFTRFVDGGSLDKFADFLSRFVQSVQAKGLTRTLFGGLMDEGEIAAYQKEQLIPQFEFEQDKDKKQQIKTKIEELDKKILIDKEQKQKAFIQTATEFSGTGGLAFATGGIINKPIQNATIGEAGPEAVVPLNQFYAKLDELIAATKSNNNVYLDLQKVNSVTDQGTYRLNS